MATADEARKQIEVTGAICRMIREEEPRSALTQWCVEHGKEELITRLNSITNNWSSEKFDCQQIRSNSITLIQRWDEEKLDDFTKRFEGFMPKAQSMQQMISQFQIPRGPTLPNVPPVSVVVESAEAFNKILCERIQLNKAVHVHGIWFMPMYANGQVAREMWVVLVQ